MKVVKGSQVEEAAQARDSLCFLEMKLIILKKLLRVIICCLLHVVEIINSYYGNQHILPV